MDFFECREDRHIKLLFIIHEKTVTLSQKINGIYIPENLVWYPHGSPTHVQKCEWVAVPYFRGSFILQCIIIILTGKDTKLTNSVVNASHLANRQ